VEGGREGERRKLHGGLVGGLGGGLVGGHCGLEGLFCVLQENMISTTNHQSISIFCIFTAIIRVTFFRHQIRKFCWFCFGCSFRCLCFSFGFICLL
jgi:hypothetical protein